MPGWGGTRRPKPGGGVKSRLRVRRRSRGERVGSDQAKATITTYFGAWRATGVAPKIDLPKIAANAPVAAVVPDASRVQDETSLVETVPIERTNPDFYALELGDHVLGGGFYATRLYRDLRQ